MIDTFLFDMDGTLLSMDIDNFSKKYFSSLCKYFLDIIDPDKMQQALKMGVYKMQQAKGDMTTIDTFFNEFCKHVNIDETTLRKKFNSFYENEFDALRDGITKNEDMIQATNILKEKGYTLCVATSPMFPMIAQKKRLAWSGVNPNNFVYISSGDECKFTKPHKGYYDGVLKNISKQASNCYMIGNDVVDDMTSQEYGFKTYLVTNYLRGDDSNYKGLKGNSKEFLKYAMEIEGIK